MGTPRSRAEQGSKAVKVPRAKAVRELEKVISEKTKKGYQQPLFLGLRDDKDAEDCTLPQLVRTNRAAQ